MRLKEHKSHPKHDLTGTRFGRLVVEELQTRRLANGKTRRFWLCRCDCGESAEIRSDQLTRGIAQSCGCLQREVAAKLGRSGATQKTINLRKLRARRAAKGLPPNLGIRDLTGRRFGRLKVITFAGIQNQQSRWRCQCDCGRKTVVTAARLNYGWTKSCGCLQSQGNHYRHGQATKGDETPEYCAWRDMKTRCYNPNNNRWEEYGGRGITVCKRWLNSFDAFFEDIGPRPSPHHSLDRKNNNGNYTKLNCRWATSSQQNGNRRFRRPSSPDKAAGRCR